MQEVAPAAEYDPAAHAVHAPATAVVPSIAEKVLAMQLIQVE